MQRAADFLVGLARAVLLVVALLGLLQCAGCANGVQMTDEERIACRNEGCAVFTEAELRALQHQAAGVGYRKGWTDATRQAGKDL